MGSYLSRVGISSCAGLFLVLSCLSSDYTSAGEVFMACKVEGISAMCGKGLLFAIHCSLC